MYGRAPWRDCKGETMVMRGRRWARSLLLACPCALLYLVHVTYHAGFFGVPSEASLVHLHFGYVLAIAMLYRDRLPLRLCVATMLVMWLATTDPGAAPWLTYIAGVAWGLLTYGLLIVATRCMGWPRTGAPFGVSDVSSFVVFGLLLLPLTLVGASLLIEVLITRPLPEWGELASDQVQMLFAKEFGVLVLALPMVVLGTHTRARADWWRAPPWRLLALGVLLPVALLQLAPHWGWRESVLPGLLDNRLLIAALLVWASLRLHLRWSMPLLVLTQLLFAAGLARHAADAVQLADIVGLLRTVAECGMLQLLVLMLMLYNNEREAASAQHERDSLTEPSSGLPNLVALRRRCGLRPPTLGLLQLDQTERIGAYLGLIARAALIRWVAARLRGVAEVYVIGTGQLVLLPFEGRDAVDWDLALERLHGADFVWAEQRVRVLPYLGVATDEDTAETLDERLQRASHATIEARQRGEVRWLQADRAAGNGHALASRQHTLSLASVVFSRIRSGEVELYFQPIAPLAAPASGRLSGEVLCRLRDAGGRLVMPGQFLPELQEDGRMAELDLAVLGRLAQWLHEHRERLPSLGYVSVNIAGQSLASRAFARELLVRVDSFPLPAHQLCFEITETAAIVHAQESALLFAQLRERGCHLAIDDFGVGYQSFERLKQIPVDLIKIDGSFVRQMRHCARDLELVRASVRIAHAFGAQTAAEFVEDAATARLLQRLRVDWMQGNYIGPAAPMEEILRPLASPQPRLQRVTGNG